MCHTDNLLLIATLYTDFSESKKSRSKECKQKIFAAQTPPRTVYPRRRTFFRRKASVQSCTLKNIIRFSPKQATINQNLLFHKLTSTFPQNPQRVTHIKSTGNQQVTHKVFHREKISESRQDKHFGSCPQFPHPLLLLLLPINNIYYIIFISDKRKMKG